MYKYKNHNKNWRQKNKLYLILLLIITISYFLTFTLFKPSKTISVTSDPFKSLDIEEILPKVEIKSKEPKIILFYTKKNPGIPWLPPKYLKNSNYKIKCPAKCVYTENKEFLTSAHAVVVDVLQSYKKRIPPLKRDQILIATTQETPLYHAGQYFSFDKFNSHVDWTATYRRNSTINWSYGYFYPKLNTRLGSHSLQKGRQQKIAVALISNCGALSGRDKIIEEMRNYIDIDIYGKCGSPCPGPSRKCRQNLGRQYKFFLAFENALCEDYVTEKFYDAFNTGMVPIVYGLGDYTKLAPANSYLNIFDYPSIKELTSHMLRLHENETEFLKYFEWRRHFSVQSNKFDLNEGSMCRICQKLWSSEPSSFFKEKPIQFGRWYNNKMTGNSTIHIKNYADFISLVEGPSSCRRAVFSF